jgi:hypothetical protein
MERNYRQYSYSENNAKDLSIRNPDINNNLDTQYESLLPETPLNKVGHYLFKRFLMFTIHLSLIALFEIIFFFNVIVNYENNSFYGIIDGFTNPLSLNCINYNYTEKMVITNILGLFINMSDVDNEANQSIQFRNAHNNKILLKSWMYFLGLVLLSIIFIILNYFKQKKVNMKKVLIDNLIMISLLGLYEFIFFKTIILNYFIVNNIELSKYILMKISVCLN